MAVNTVVKLQFLSFILFNLLKYCNPFGMAAQQRRLVQEKRQFFDFKWLQWQRPLMNQKRGLGLSEVQCSEPG